jgi:hypothetical protein
VRLGLLELLLERAHGFGEFEDSSYCWRGIDCSRSCTGVAATLCALYGDEAGALACDLVRGNARALRFAAAS